MRKRTIKLGLVAATAFSAALPLFATQAAYADYGPSKGDVVGVGSDTLQNMIDFLFDGSAYADPGYNANLNKFKAVSIDATADANVRLAYGPDGNATAANGGSCSPGTGSVQGSANGGPTAGGTNGSTTPCVLNPTVVLRAGQLAVQRPNGSGSGIKALQQDVLAGNNMPSGPHQEIINFSRSSAAQAPAAKFGLDSIQVATDTLPIVVANTTNAVPLSNSELKAIYGANTGTCLKWNQLTGNSAGSADTIIPIMPQPGAGTSKFFLSQIGLTAPGTCVTFSEENDPSAITQVTTPADAIEPVSQGRLGLFAGTNNSFPNVSQPAGYFLDPSCPYNVNTTSGTSICGSGTGITFNQTTVAAASNGTNITALGGTLNVASTTGFPASGSIEVETLSGNAVLNYTGTSASTFTGVTVANTTQGGAQSGVLQTGGNVVQSTGTYFTNPVLPAVKVLATTGNAGDGSPVFDPTRPLYIYFRDSDIYSTVPFQPGTTVNWLNTLFYNPCLAGQTGCVSGPAGANEYGPSGQPYIDQAGGQQLLTDAGVTPVDTGATTSFTKGGA